jgi:pyruvate formate lyase activating enzyme
MLVGGMQPCSLIDFPGKIAAVIFTRGCNGRCGYCHNPELVDPDRFCELIPLSEVLSFLQKRRGLLDGVVITGGEPTLQPDLLEVMAEIKFLGYAIKLDTNGCNPLVVERVIERKLADYIAMDIKAPLEEYVRVFKTVVHPATLQASIGLIMTSGIPYEFRTTVVKDQLSRDDLVSMARQVEGARLYALQKFVDTKTQDSSFSGKCSYSDEEFYDLKQAVSPYVKSCIIR